MEQLLQVAVAPPSFSPINLLSLAATSGRDVSSSSSSNSAGSNVSDSEEATEPAIASPGVTCVVCARVVQDENRLANHMGVHTGMRPHECTTCGQGFVSTWDLTQHALSHSKVRPFPCPVCGKSFKRKWEMSRHEGIHKQEPRNFQCAECSKFFQTKATLASHMRIHIDDKPFACSLCDKRFKRKGELTLHNRSHTGERPFQCPHCPKGFRQKGTLTQHLSTHTTERPFACPHCDVHFRHKSSVLRHLRVHNQEPSSSSGIHDVGALLLPHEDSSAKTQVRFECATCGQFFKHRSSLSRHLLKHSSGAPQSQSPKPPRSISRSNKSSTTSQRKRSPAARNRTKAKHTDVVASLDFTIEPAPAFSLDLVDDCTDSPVLVPAASDLGDDDDDPVTIGRHRLDAGDDNDEVPVSVGGDQVYSLDAGAEDDELALVTVLTAAGDEDGLIDSYDACNVIDSIQYDEDPAESSETMCLDSNLLVGTESDEIIAADLAESVSSSVQLGVAELESKDEPYVLPNGMSLRKRKRSTSGSAQFDSESGVEVEPDSQVDPAAPDIFDTFEPSAALDASDDDFVVLTSMPLASTPIRVTRSATKRQRSLDLQPTNEDATCSPPADSI